MHFSNEIYTLQSLRTATNTSALIGVGVESPVSPATQLSFNS